MLNAKKQEPGSGMTLESQMNVPVTNVSQPTANKPLIDQVQPSTIKVESIPVSEIGYYEFNEDDILRDISIEARPLVLDECYKIKPKDPHYAFRWVEYKANEGYYYNKAVVAGFINALPEDLIEHRGTVKENKVFIGDVILMKMLKNHYGGLIKRNLLASNAMISSKNAVKGAIKHAGTVVTNGGGQPRLDGPFKAEFFEPSKEDLVIKDSRDRELGTVHDLPNVSKGFETLK